MTVTVLRGWVVYSLENPLLSRGHGHFLSNLRECHFCLGAVLFLLSAKAKASGGMDVTSICQNVESRRRSNASRTESRTL